LYICIGMGFRINNETLIFIPAIGQMAKIQKTFYILTNIVRIGTHLS
jgi:hypothetical protein